MENYKKFLQEKKIWKKTFFGMSNYKFFRTLLTLEFIFNSFLPFKIKNLFLICFISKMEELEFSVLVLRFLKSQEESIWGRFFIIFYEFQVNKNRIFSHEFKKIRTDLRLIFNMSSVKSRNTEFIDKFEKLYIEKTESRHCLSGEKETKSYFKTFRIKSVIKLPFFENGISYTGIHALF